MFGKLGSMADMIVAGIMGIAVSFIILAIVFIALCKYTELFNDEFQARWKSKAFALLGISMAIFGATGLATILQQLGSSAF